MSVPWRTLRGRLALASLVGLVVATVAFTLLGAQLVRSETQRRELDDLSSKAQGIASLMTQDFTREIQRRGEYNPPAERIDTLKAIAGGDTELTWIGTSVTPGGDPENLNVREQGAVDLIDLPAMRREGVDVFEYQRDGESGRRMAAAAPVLIEDDIIAATVLLTRPKSEVLAVGQNVANRVWIAGALGLLAAALISAFLTGRALRPLNRLQDAANAVGQGKLDTRVEAVGIAEIDALAASFNSMVRELRHRDHLSREFLMRVTHDLRTPLTAIQGHAQALSDGVVPPDLMPTSLAAIDGEATRLSDMVTDLLDLAKLEARRFKLDIRQADAADLVQQAFDAHRVEAGRAEVRYISRFEPLPQITTDPSRVRQVLGNLIDNALRWTPAGGTVEVTARSDISARVTIIVQDSGPGVPLERHDEVFEPFRSMNTPDGRSGSGLGLAISRQLARALGGDLYLDPNVTTGSRFVLELPTESTEIHDSGTDTDSVDARPAVV